MEYGSLLFEVVWAVIKIAFMILGFLMPLASMNLVSSGKRGPRHPMPTTASG